MMTNFVYHAFRELIKIKKKKKSAGQKLMHLNRATCMLALVDTTSTEIMYSQSTYRSVLLQS